MRNQIVTVLFLFITFSTEPLHAEMFTSGTRNTATAVGMVSFVGLIISGAVTAALGHQQYCDPTSNQPDLISVPQSYPCTHCHDTYCCTHGRCGYHCQECTTDTCTSYNKFCVSANSTTDLHEPLVRQGKGFWPSFGVTMGFLATTLGSVWVSRGECLIASCYCILFCLANSR